MLFSVEQAFVGREEIRSPLKTSAGEARPVFAKNVKSGILANLLIFFGQFESQS